MAMPNSVTGWGILRAVRSVKIGTIRSIASTAVLTNSAVSPYRAKVATSTPAVRISIVG